MSANKPVHVVGGNGCGNVPIEAPSCDNFFDAIAPVNTWGKSFLIAPFAFKPSGSRIRVVTSQPNTEVRLNDAVVATISVGEKYDVVLTEPAHIETDKPAQVMQYMQGSSLDTDMNGDPVGDPSMMVVVPTEQFHDDYLVSPGRDISLENESFNIVIPTASLPSFRLDGEAIDTSQFAAIPGTSFSTGTITRDLPSPTPTLEGYPSGAVYDPSRGRAYFAWPMTADEPFGVYAYGFAGFGSIAHPGGQRFEIINPIGDVFSPAGVVETVGDSLQIRITDSEDVNANGVIDTGEDLNNDGILGPRTEDLNGDDVLQSTEDTNNNDFLDVDLGIQSVDLLPGSTNLDVVIPTIEPGVASVNLTATRMDLTLPADGTLRVVDLGGNTLDIPLALGPVGITNVRVVSRVSNQVEIDPASYTVPPFSVTPGPDDTAVEWRFDTYDTDQIESLSYEVVLRDPIPFESRPITTALELFYTDVNGNDVTQELGLFAVNVLETALELGVLTDNSVYQANDSVGITVELTNLSDVASSRNLRISVKDDKGVDVAVIANIDGVSLPGLGSQTISNQSFDVGQTVAGFYEVHAEILDTGGLVVQSATAPFNIGAPLSEMVSASVNPNVSTFGPYETVQITSRVINESVNQFLNGASISTTVLAPDGAVVAATTNVVSQLGPGALQNYVTPVPLGAAAPGNYNIQVDVSDAQGVSIATASSVFDVLSTAESGAGLSAEVTTSADPVSIGDTLTIATNLQNIGNTAIIDLDYDVVVFDPLTGATIASFRSTVEALGPGGTDVDSNNWTVAGAPGSVLGVAVTTSINGQELTLGSTFFGIEDSNVQLDGDVVVGERGRILILLDPMPTHHHHGYHQSGCGYWSYGYGHYGDVYNGEAERQLLEELLDTRGWSYKIVTDREWFTAEFRTGGYSSYAVLSRTVNIGPLVERELIEAVYRGEGLVVAGDNCNRNTKLKEALGGKNGGRVFHANAVILEPSELFTGTSMDLLSVQRRHDIRVQGSTVVGNYNTHHPHFNDALTIYEFGNGRSVHAGFDLLAEATEAGDESIAANLLAEAIGYTHPVSIKPTSGIETSLSVKVENLGDQTTGAAILRLPIGTVVNDGGAATELDAMTWEWPFSLAEHESRSNDFYVNLGDAGGFFEIEIVSGELETRIRQDLILLELQAVHPGGFGDLLSGLEALEGTDPAYSRAVKKVKKARIYFLNGRLRRSIDSLLDAIDRVATVGTPESHEQRIQISMLIREISRQL